MKYLKILNQFLSKNKKKAIGYTENEILNIEKLYDIRIIKDFKTFLLNSGRSDGGLLGDTVVIYRDYYSIRNQVLFQLTLEYDLPEFNWFNDKPFIFAVIAETNYCFLKTKDDDLMVYIYIEGSKEIFSSDMCFDDFMVWLINEENPNLEFIGDNIGELLIIK